MATSWQRLKQIAADALELQTQERLNFLREKCGADTELFAEARNLILADESAGAQFLDESELPWAVRPLEPGFEIGPYCIENLLGEGGTSEVYRARQAEPVVRYVALKLLKPGMDSRALLARFAAERRTLARLDHPGIARVLDAGALSSGRPWVVVDLVTGQPLTRFATAAHLDQDQCLQLFLQVCEAVAHAHRRGIVHRDLKPANVLVTNEDGAPLVKVIDFGIAKLLEPGEEENPRTTTGMLLGTPAYASPEQLSERADVDTRTDIWALGVMFYELLTHSRPTDRADDQEPAIAELMRRVRNDAIEAPSRRAKKRGLKSVPAELDWIAGKALEHDRERRYATVDAFASDVRRYLAREPLSVGPPTLRYRLATAARRHRVFVVASLVVAVALLAGSIASTAGFLSANAAREEAERAEHAEYVQRLRAEELAKSEVEARQAAETARQEAETVSKFLTDLFASAKPSKRGRDVRVVDLLDAAEARYAAVSRFPTVEIRLREVVGKTYLELGSYAEAENHLTHALRSAHEHFGVDDPRTLIHLFNLADLKSRQGHRSEAMAMIEELDQRAHAAHGPEHAFRRFVVDFRANSAFEQGRYTEAVAAMLELIELDHAKGRIASELQSLGNLSQILLRQGRIDEAIPYAEKSYALALEHHGPRHPVTIACARKLAAVHVARQDYPKLVAATEALAITAEEVLGELHPDTLGIKNYLALGYQHTQHLDEAEALYRQLIAGQATNLVREHPQAMMALRNLSAVLEQKGAWEEAEALMRDFVERTRASRGAEHVETQFALCAATRLASLGGKSIQVHEEYAQAIEQLRRHLKSDDQSLIRVEHEFLMHLQARGAALVSEQQTAAAEEAWTAAHTLASSLRKDDARVAAALALAALCESRGDAEAAARWSESAR